MRIGAALCGLILALSVLSLHPGAAVSGERPPPRPDADKIAMGLALTNTYCADCHAIGETGDSSHPAAPPFRDLHLRYDVTFLSEALVEGLATAHPDMPEFEFEPRQADAIITYLQSLETYSEPNEQ